MKKYIIYDGRAVDEEGVEEATVMEMCDTLKEAIANAPDYGEGCCVWSFDEDKDVLTNGKLEKIVFSE